MISSTRDAGAGRAMTRRKLLASAAGALGVIAAACTNTAPPTTSGAATAVATAAQGAATPITAAATQVAGAASTAAAPISATATALAKASPAAGGATMVNMTDANKFDPATLTVAKGGTVTWRNASSVQHTATDDPAKASNKADAQLPSGVQAWDSGMVGPGQTFAHTFDVAGTYKYFCTVHESAGMVGTITVQ